MADLIATLDETQLATPSLCVGWDVKTVAAHLAEIRGSLGTLMMAAAGRSSFLDQLGGPGLPALRQRLSTSH